MESALKNLGVIKHPSYLTNDEVILENLFYCHVMQKHCSIRDMNKIAFRMLFVGVHVTFNCYSNASKLQFFI